MKLLANENFPLKSVQILHGKRFDIVHIGTDFSGIDDHQVIDLAIRESRTIITFDKDYGELIFKKGLKPNCGVIFLKWTNFLPEDPGLKLYHIFKGGKMQFHNALTVIDDKSIRQKKF